MEIYMEQGDQFELTIQVYCMEFEIDQVLRANYANIQDKHQLQNMIVQHKSIINNLLKQIHELVNIKDKEQLERDIILNKMQENMLENTRQIINFKNLVNQTTDAHHKITKQFEEEKEKTKKNLQMQHQLELNDLNKKCEELEQEYRQLQEAEEKEQAYLREIKQLKQSLVSRQYEHHDRMNQEQKRQMKQNNEIDNLNQNKIQEVRKNVYHVARNIVVQEKASNQEKNEQLKTRLHQLQQELAVIKKNRNDILAKRKELKINLSINEEELEEYKAVGSLQKAKIKSYKDKIDAIKAVIEEQVASREAKIAEIKKSKTAEGKALKSKLLQLQRQQEEMKIRIQQMKVLAETILMQREQVEQFFIMALEGCKKEIEKEKEGSLVTGKQKQSRNYGEKVDIEELSAKDKQRILTNLYTKLALGP